MNRGPVRGNGQEVEVEVTMAMAVFQWQEKQINAIICRLINVAILAVRLVICKWGLAKGLGSVQDPLVILGTW